MVISINGKIGCGKDITGKIIQALSLNDKFYTKYPHQVKWDTAEFHNSDFIIQKFAEELKQTICRWIGCEREQLEDQEFKNKELSEEWWYYWNKIDNKIECSYYSASVYVKENIYAYELIKLTPRLLLQLLGTEAGRDIIHPDLWVNILFSKYQPQVDKWIITDLRFPNEFKRIKKEKGITIRIERPIEQRFPEAWEDFNIAADKDYPRTEENFIKFLQVSNWEPYRKLAASITHYSEIALDDCDEFDYIINNNGTLEELIEKIRLILIQEKIIKYK